MSFRDAPHQHHVRLLQQNGINFEVVTKLVLVGAPTRVARNSADECANPKFVEAIAKLGGHRHHASATRSERVIMMVAVATPRLASGMEQVSPTKKIQTNVATATMKAMHGRARRHRLITPTLTLTAKSQRNHPQQASWNEPLVVLSRLMGRTPDLKQKMRKCRELRRAPTQG